MTCEVKLRTLAAANVTLQTDLGTDPFRWTDRRLVQGLLQFGTCMRITRVSTAEVGFYNQGGQGNIEQPRFQLDVIDYDPEKARSVAIDIIAFLSSISLMSATPTNARQTTNYKLNQRSSMEYELDPPAYVETLDYRVWNNNALALP